LSDWSDVGECHDEKEVERGNGRIFKITYGNAKPWQGDLAKLDDSQLVVLQLHENDWFVRHARRLLQERHAKGKVSDSARQKLREILQSDPSIPHRLRALWA